MDSDETPYLLPEGERLWVIKTATAGGLLPQMLERFRAGNAEPLFFGDAGQPEGAVVPFDEVAAEYGIDLDKPVDDSDLPKSQ